MTGREPGFYWIRIGGEWTTGRFWGDVWNFPGQDNDAETRDADLDEIGPRIEPPTST